MCLSLIFNADAQLTLHTCTNAHGSLNVKKLYVQIKTEHIY